MSGTSNTSTLSRATDSSTNDFDKGASTSSKNNPNLDPSTSGTSATATDAQKTEQSEIEENKSFIQDAAKAAKD